MKPVGRISARSAATPSHNAQMLKKRKPVTTAKKNAPATTQPSPLTDCITNLPILTNGIRLDEHQTEQHTQQPSRKRRRAAPRRFTSSEEEEEGGDDDYDYEDRGGRVKEEDSAKAKRRPRSPTTNNTAQEKEKTTSHSADESNGNKKDAYKCPFCDHRSGRPNNLVIHINSKHCEQTPPRTYSQDPAECISEAILYFIATKKEFEEKMAALETQVAAYQSALADAVGQMDDQQRAVLKRKAGKQQDSVLSQFLEDV